MKSHWIPVVMVIFIVTACAPTRPSQSSPRPEPSLAASSTVSAVAPTQAAAATLTVPTPDWAGLKLNEVAGGDPALAEQAESSHIAWLRDASGIRAELGSQADEIFAEMDQARAQAIQGLLAQLQPHVKPMGMPAPLLQTGMTSFASMLLLLPIDMVRSYDGDGVSPRSVKDESFGDAQVHLEVQFTIAGSSLQVEIEMTTKGVKDGVAYQERGGGKIRVNLCPDAQGNVPLELTYHQSTDVGGHGYQFQITDSATGHVDDEANLIAYDQELQIEDAVQSSQGNEYAQVNMKFNTSGANTENTTVTGMTITVPRASSNASAEFVGKVRDAGMSQAFYFIVMAFHSAEKKWQNGYCVAVALADGSTEQAVPVSSDTAFTAKVTHKIEGKELTAPVIATLTSGKVSVSPSGAKVPAPATFRYKAPDTNGETATVELVSRSRRGIGTLIVTFRTDSYELVFDSTITATIDDESVYTQLTMQVHSQVPLKAAPGKPLQGEAPLDYLAFSPTIESRVEGLVCGVVQTQSEPDTLKVLEADTGQDVTGTLDVSRIRLSIVPVPAGNMLGVTQCNGLGTFAWATHFFPSLFYELHDNERTDNGYMIATWEPGTAGVVARKVYRRNAVPCYGGSGVCNEETTLELVKPH